MKLPRLPHPGNILDAKYTKEQMHAYAMRFGIMVRDRCVKVCDDAPEPDGFDLAIRIQEEVKL
jgi:hypothetical protein